MKLHTSGSCPAYAITFSVITFSAITFSAITFSAITFSAITFSAITFSALALSNAPRVVGAAARVVEYVRAVYIG